MSGAALRLEGVWLALGPRLLVPPLTLTVAPGTATTLMGPSGCGKSSLLASLCGMLEPAFRCGGRAWLGDRELGPLPPERRRLGILFQDDLLFPHLTVGENISFGLPPGPRARRRAELDAALADAGLAGFANRDPATLSGGQRARIALLRTLAARPEALLLDEPFAKLDSELRNRFRNFVFDHGRRGRYGPRRLARGRFGRRSARGEFSGGRPGRFGAGRPAPGAFGHRTSGHLLIGAVHRAPLHDGHFPGPAQQPGRHLAD